MAKTLAFSLLSTAIMTTGCGDEAEPKESQTYPDQNADTDTDTGSLTDDCTFTGFSGESIEVTGGDDWFLLALNEAGDGGLRVESWESFDGPTEVGEYSLGGNNYADCGLCVMMYEDCEGDVSADSCDKVFFATEGTVDIVTFDTSGTGGGPLEVELTADKVHEHFEAFLAENPDWTRDSDG